jgi:hypothetical protein
MNGEKTTRKQPRITTCLTSLAPLPDIEFLGASAPCCDSTLWNLYGN